MHASPASSPHSHGSEPPPPLAPHEAHHTKERCWWTVPEFSLALGLRRPRDPDPNRRARDLLVRSKALRRQPGGQRHWVVTVSSIKKMWPDDYPEVLAKLRAFDFEKHARSSRRRAQHPTRG